jgi:hypothetical protein
VSAPQLRIVAGGSVGAQERAAITEAVLRVMRTRAAVPGAANSEWARAGRLEAAGTMTVRSRAGLPPR